MVVKSEMQKGVFIGSVDIQYVAVTRSSRQTYTLDHGEIGESGYGWQIAPRTNLNSSSL